MVNKIDRGLHKELAHSLRILLLILSGPVDFAMLSFIKTFLTIRGVIMMFESLASVKYSKGGMGMS